MIKYSYILLFVFTGIFGCRPTKKVQKIEEAISKKDTAATVIIPKTNEVDSSKLMLAILEKVNHKRIEFSTFSAKAKIDYESQEGNDGGTAHIRLEKNKTLWVSLTGPLGIEGYRMLVTPDSVVLMNKLNKTVQYRTIEYLQELTDIPFDFQTLQDLIVGNPIFANEKVVSYKETGNQLLVMIVGDVYKHLLTLNNADYTLMHSKLDDVDVTRNRTCDITYSDYETNAGFPFATKREIAVSEKGKLQLSLDFKQYAFNQPLTFPFNIPKNYKVK
jgi:outer membrane lipoprotein-sorting protein